MTHGPTRAVAAKRRRNFGHVSCEPQSTVPRRYTSGAARCSSAHWREKQSDSVPQYYPFSFVSSSLPFIFSKTRASGEKVKKST